MDDPLKVTLTLAVLVLAMIVAGVTSRANRPFPWFAAVIVIAAMWR